MQLRHLTAALAASASLFAVPAQAAAGGPGVSCSSSMTTVFGNDTHYAGDCQGPLVGTLGAGLAASATFGTQLYTLFATTLDGSNRLGASLGDASAAWGSLLLSAPRTGSFVLGLQGGGTYSLYLFNSGTTGLSAIEFDTGGITQGLSGPGSPLFSQAALFTAAVPEPGTYAFMLSGLLVLGFLAQRRRAAETRR
jgi:PEP-CTERM motif